MGDAEEDVFTRLTPKYPIDETKVRIRCTCGNEYRAAQNQLCPACGKYKPSVITIDGITWKTLAQFKLDKFHEMLESGALDEIPAEYREMMRKNIETQIRQLEDGSWKEEARRKIATYRKMLEPRLQKHIPMEDCETLRTSLESMIQKLQQELEAGGESP